MALNLAIARLLVGESDGLIDAVAARVEEQRVADVVRGVAVMMERDIALSAFVLNTLRCALWYFLNTDSIEGAVVRAVNFGGPIRTAPLPAPWLVTGTGLEPYPPSGGRASWALRR
ncbi:MAG: hypothetical protein QGH66_02080 [Dehalococcoidia bacterium]|nr:hypothetical protein [Dehalococcoidia bacterium]MDP7240176.1 hypothetical protein [Dehalococcoidia bacterium]MDP7470125.1 hypothetical protein [Dehalococcoidia bacterium]